MNDDLTGRTPLRPTLYRLAEDGRSLDFYFAQCPHCDGLTFPANAPGCMHCGHPLDASSQVTRPGGGTLLEFVTLHVPMAPGLPAPSIAGDLRIAEGVVEEGVLAVKDEQALSPGMRMRAIAVPVESTAHFSCQFVPEGAAEVRA